MELPRTQLMDGQAEDQAVALLIEAARTGVPLDALPPETCPTTPAEALAIQHRIVAASGKDVAGWKVATTTEGVSTYGAIYTQDCYPTPAIVQKDLYPLMGIEGEIAFRLLCDLPDGPALTREELEPMLAPFPAIEIVASRFAHYDRTPPLVRLADRMSNGGMVIGDAKGAPADLSQLAVQLTVDGQLLVDQIGGHARGDPLLPVLEFVNAVRPRLSLREGQFITAGTFTGLKFGNAGEDWEVLFSGLGRVQLTIT